MNSLRVLTYRLYFAIQDSGVGAALRRWQFASQRLDRVRLLIKRQIAPDRQVWVCAQSGLSRGLWMRLRFPEEARFWRVEHEPEVQNAIAAVVRPGDVVYDIGAFVGTVSLGVTRLVAQSGRVVAFDGDPENVARLRESGVRNQLDSNLLVVHAAVWSHSARDGISFRRGRLKRSEGGVEANGERAVLADGELIKVPAITLDDFIAERGPVPDLLKIDVEGGEYEVLRGGASLFSGRRPLLIVEVHRREAAEQISAWLQEYRYAAHWNIPKEGFPRALFAWPAERRGKPWEDSIFERHS